MSRQVSRWRQWASLFAAALLVLQGNRSASAVPQESNGDILLITSKHDPYSQIIRVKADGSERKVLTAEKEYAADPRLSPDGKRVSFIAVVGDIFAAHQEVGLYVMNADGSGRKRLAEKELGDRTPAAPQWSPDGKRLAFCTRPQGLDGHKYRLYIVDADGGNLKRLETPEAFAPVWSADGKGLLITRAYDPKTGRWRPSLCTAKVDGMDLHELVPWAQTGAWSPDGTRLAFAALFRPRGDREEPEPGGLFVARADGSHPKRIAKLGKEGFSKTEPGFLHLFSVQWSSDSKRLFFSRIGQRDNDVEKTVRPWMVYVIDADGRNLRQVTAADTPEFLGATTNTER